MIQQLTLILSFVLFFSLTKNISAQNPCNQKDSLALLRLSNALNLDTLSIQPWEAGRVGTWRGITMAPDFSVGGIERVRTIDLSALGLGGIIPDSLFQGDSLNQLFIFRLNENNITGVAGLLRPDNNGNPPYLRELDISYNSFASGTYNLFDFLMMHMSNLEILRANSVFTVTPFPTAITDYNFGSTPLLTTLELNDNMLSGTLPLGFLTSTWTNFAFLLVSNNLFDTLAPPLTTAPAFQKLEINNNKLQDFQPIEELVRNAPMLTWLFASNAMDTALINDTLTFSLLANHTGLNVLDLSYNKLRGTIPVDMFEKLSSLQFLHLNDNRLSGELPTPTSTIGTPPLNGALAYGSLGNLSELYLSNNQLFGDLRLDWLFGAQLAANIGTAGSSAFSKLHIDGNKFSEIKPQLNDVIATDIATTFNQRFDNLTSLKVHNNAFKFRDLFKLKKIFRLRQLTIGSQAHYVPIMGVDSSDFQYAPQASLGIGGVRRRNAGQDVILDSDNGIGIPESTFTNYINNRYTWQRIDTSNLAGGTPILPVIQHIGAIQQTGAGTAPNLQVYNVGGLAQTNTSYQVGLDTTVGNIFKLGINNLDSAQHHNWLFRAKITNDSFPMLLLFTIPKKIEVGGCIDGSGAPIHCQTMIVQFHPDTLAMMTPMQQDSLKLAIRMEIGAEPIEVCLCGDIELWGISDTASAMLEGNGSGTKNASSQVSARPQLLSADPNYSLLGGSGSSLPDSVSMATGQGNATAKTLVAIVDSGMDYEYVGLKPYISEGASSASTCMPNATWGYNFLDDNNNATDDHGHGTAVAGIIAGISQQSILPDTGSMKTDIGILPLKYTNKSGAGSLFHAACAMRYAADYERQITGGTAKVRVINASWGYYGDPCMVLENVLKYVGEDCGVLIVASAGNDGKIVQGVPANRHWPSNSIFDPTNTDPIDNILAVGGSNTNSNFLHPNSNYGNFHIDLAAPWFENSTLAGSTNGFGAVAGTSFAAPQVSRAAALLFDKYPDATYFAVKYALMNGVDILQSADSLKLKSRGRINFHKADSIMNIIMDRTLCSEGITINVDKIENIEQYIKIYPNPVADNLNLEIDHNLDADNINVSVFNVQGQLLHQQELERGTTNATIPTQNLPSGVYFVQIQLNKRQFSQKIIKL